MEKKAMRYLAAAIFLLLFLMIIISRLEPFYSLDLIDLLYYISYLLMAIGLFIGMPILSTTGFSIMALYRLYWLFYWLFHYISVQTLQPLILEALNAAIFMLFALTSIRLSSARKTGIIAAVVAIVRLAFDIITCVVAGYDYSIIILSVSCLLISGAISLGMACEQIGKEKEAAKAASALNMARKRIPSHRMISNSNVEKLMRLKNFLDEGIISQDEFDAKKKQLLNL